MASPSDLLQGTLDLLVLRTLASGSMNGWGISQRIQLASRGVLDVNQGSLYPALRRLELRGLIEGAWSASENNRRARFYTLTTDGKAALRRETADWRHYVEAVGLILENG